MTVEIDGEEKDRRRKDTAILPTGGGDTKTPDTWKLFMHLCSHVVQKKSTTYLFETGRDLRSTGTLLTPTHCKSNLNLCYQRWRVY